jgi:hypothetical protein
MDRQGRGLRRKQQGRHYERPELRKRERLAEVTEQFPPRVTDGGAGPKGGCFERREQS